jgi:hypothetical protein
MEEQMSQLSDRNHPEIGNLTAAQLNALSRAAQREDCALTLPDNLKGRAADRLAQA